MLYDEVTNICRPYLGLATEAFINRQISNMKITKRSQLSQKHIKLLARGCYLSAVEIMPKVVALEMAKKILNLENNYALKKLFSPDEDK